MLLLLRILWAMSDVRFSKPPASAFKPPHDSFWAGSGGSEGPIPCQPNHCTDWCQQMAGVVQQLAAAGAQVDPEATDDDGKTPLHYAAEAGCPTLVATLVQAGADPGSTTQSGYTVLHAAVRSRRLRVVQQVLGALGSSRAAEQLRVLGSCYRDGKKSTALHSAAGKGYLEVVEALVAAGADVQQLDVEGDTSLHLAAAGGYLEVAEALVAAGADREQRGDFNWPLGATPLHLALRRGHFLLVPLLATPGNVNLHYQSEKSDGSTRSTPLHMAATHLDGYWGWQGIDGRQAARAVAVLLAAGAYVGASDGQGVTPLEAAAAQGHPRILRLLLRDMLQQQKLPAPPPLPAPLLPVPASLLRPPPQWQQQQQGGGKQQQQGAQTRHPLLLPLRDAAFVALSRRRDLHEGPVWANFFTAVADALGAQVASTLWKDLQPLLLRPQEQAGQSYAVQEQLRRHTPEEWGDRALDAWLGVWVAAIRARHHTTERMQQLVLLPLQQQQQQQQQQSPQRCDSCGDTGRPSKRPRLARELRMLQQEQQQLAVHGINPNPSSSPSAAVNSSGWRSRAARAVNRQLVIVKSGLRAAAVSSDQERVAAALEQLPDRAEGLALAAAAAGAAGHWDLCMGLLRELVVLNEAKGRAAVQQVREALQQKVSGHTVSLSFLAMVHRAGGFEKREEERACQEVMLEEALRVCDALCADWLALRQQRVRELREAVVAAVTAAAVPQAAVHQTKWRLSLSLQQHNMNVREATVTAPAQRPASPFHAAA